LLLHRIYSDFYTYRDPDCDFASAKGAGAVSSIWLFMSPGKGSFQLLSQIKRKLPSPGDTLLFSASLEDSGALKPRGFFLQG
jgi:hypothetical protein